MEGLSITLLTVLVLTVATWFLAKDFVACTVTSAGYAPANGWYSAIGGIYVKRGHPVVFFPDVFSIFALRKESAGMTLSLSQGAWVLASLSPSKALYTSKPSDPDQHLYAPPPDEWKAVDAPAADPPPAVTQCRGSLADSPPLPSGHETNIEQLLLRPVTSLLLVAICYYYYVLWAGRTDPAQVAFSYDAIVNKGEWWRMVTSSFAHFDLWHLVFNAMGLYQFGDLEFSYGSVVFAYLNADLVFLTMAICLVVHHVAVFRFGREEFLYQQAVGFSCVLFAWMVAASVRMDKFCPVFFLPSLCFSTYNIPNPFGWALPVNAGPLLLLVATKLVIPRSSFIGHLSGIVIGYPVAWNALDWLSPPLFLSIVAAGFIYFHALLPWRLPGYDKAVDLAAYATPLQLTKHAWLKTTCWPLVALSLLAAGTFGYLAAVFRLTVAYLAWCAVPARRLEWVAETRPAYDGAVILLSLAATVTGCAALYDVSNLSSAVAAFDLLTGCGLSPTFVACGLALLACLAIAEAAACLAIVAAMHDVPPCAAALATHFRADEAAMARDVQMLGLAGLVRRLTGAPPQHGAWPAEVRVGRAHVSTAV